MFTNITLPSTWYFLYIWQTLANNSQTHRVTCSDEHEIMMGGNYPVGLAWEPSAAKYALNVNSYICVLSLVCLHQCFHSPLSEFLLVSIDILNIIIDYIMSLGLMQKMPFDSLADFESSNMYSDKNGIFWKMTLVDYIVKSNSHWTHHSGTSQFVDSLFIYDFMPTILIPTRRTRP